MGSLIHHVLHLQEIRRAYDDTLRRGMRADAIMEVFDEERGWEDFWSLPMKAFSFIYIVRSATDVIVQVGAFWCPPAALQNICTRQWTCVSSTPITSLQPSSRTLQ